jgi:hypothetical protein
LLKQKVDMAVAFLPILPELQKYCTFSIALDESELTALMKRPDYSTTGTGLLAPFEQTVWLLVLTAVISVGPIIFIFVKLRLRVYRLQNVTNRKRTHSFFTHLDNLQIEIMARS